MTNIRILSILAAALLMSALTLPSRADTTDANVPTTCKDGTTSTATGRGACSGHGGVQKNGAPTAAQSAGATPLSTTQGAPAAPASATPAGSGSTCKDGTSSTSTGRGACSGHGGVQKTAKAPPPTSASAAPTAAAPTVAAGNTDPAGATAKCKDGTYSKSKQHSGSCSHHGGVAQFLTTAQ